MADRPNILFILTDQQRADMMGAYGDPVARTPHTDWLAGQGVRFDGCFAQAPLCMPSRASMLSERYVRDHGVFQNTSVVHPTVPTCVRALRDAGYRTVQTGKTHLYTHHPWDGRHMQAHADKLRAYGFVETLESAGKEASLNVDSIYTDYLAAHGLLDAYRSYVRTRSKSQWDPASGIEQRAAWTTEPRPLPLHAHPVAWLGRTTADWLRNRTDDAPFFLQVGFAGPHDPWDAPAEALAAFGDPDMPMPGTLEPPEIPDHGPLATFLRIMTKYSDTATMTPQAIARMRRAYHANMMMIDDSIGLILDALRDRGELDNTWIIYTSDHGEMMGEHRLVKKMVFYDPAVRVPLIVRPPGGTAPRQVADLVELMDVSATMRDIAGAAMAGSHARSLLPAITGADAWRGRDVVISQAYGVAMLRTDRAKLVVYEDTLEPMQYFDLAADPLENRNLVGDPGHAGAIAALMDAYARPFLATRPVRPDRSIIERGSMGKNSFFLPAQVFGAPT